MSGVNICSQSAQCTNADVAFRLVLSLLCFCHNSGYARNRGSQRHKPVGSLQSGCTEP